MAGVTRAVSTFSPAVNLEFRVLSSVIRESLLRERLMAALSSAFGVLAALLAAIGLYGVMSYTVARRANEIGIRIAIGAGRMDVLRMVLREAALLTTAGVVVGAVLAMAAGTPRALLFGSTGPIRRPSASRLPSWARSGCWPGSCPRAARRGSIPASRCGTSDVRRRQLVATLTAAIRR